MSGCLYDYGPHTAKTRRDAIEGVLAVFADLSKAELRRARRNLRADGIHYFGDKLAAGADYCEISEQPGPCPDTDDS